MKIRGVGGGGGDTRGMCLLKLLKSKSAIFLTKVPFLLELMLL